MWTIFTAVEGTRSPHNASTSASIDTVRFASSSRRASSARLRCPPVGTARPSQAAARDAMGLSRDRGAGSRTGGGHSPVEHHGTERPDAGGGELELRARVLELAVADPGVALDPERDG